MAFKNRVRIHPLGTGPGFHLSDVAQNLSSVAVVRSRLAFPVRNTSNGVATVPLGWRQRLPHRLDCSVPETGMVHFCVSIATWLYLQ